MRVRNHIAYRFLTDEFFLDEGMELMHGKGWDKKPLEEISQVYNLLTFHEMIPGQANKTYYITDTVIEKLDMLKVNKSILGVYNWTVFSEIPLCKRTFIFNNNTLLRMVVIKEIMYFVHLSFTYDKGSKTHGQSYYVFFYVDRESGEQCSHFEHPDVKKIETFIYKLLCFVFLSENTEEVILPGRKTGTQKTGKFINEFQDIPVTIVTSKWKVTVIRNEGFDVSGHFRLQPYGPGLKQTKVIFIEPFQKHGYKRTYGEGEPTHTGHIDQNN